MRDIDPRGGFLRNFTNPQTYRNLLYLFLSFPLGLFYFVFLITGFSVGFGLSFIIIGLPILLFMLGASRGLAAFERRLAVALLDADMEPSHSSARPGQSIVQRYVNWGTIKDILYLFAKFPLGLGTFVASATAFSLIVGLILAPFYYNAADVTMGGPGFIANINSLPAALAASAVGFVLAFIALPIFNFLAELWRDFTVMMLDEGSRAYDDLYDSRALREYDDYYSKPKNAATRGRLVEVPASYQERAAEPRKSKRLPTLQEQIDAALTEDDDVDVPLHAARRIPPDDSTAAQRLTLEERIRAALGEQEHGIERPASGDVRSIRPDSEL